MGMGGSCSFAYCPNVFAKALKLATAGRREDVYNRTGEPSATFLRKRRSKGAVWMAYFLPKAKNKPEQSGLCSDVVDAKGLEPMTFRTSSGYSTS